MSEDPDVVSIEVAARMLGIGRRTAYELARRGELPGAVRVGGRWRVSLIRYRREIHGEGAA